ASREGISHSRLQIPEKEVFYARNRQPQIRSSAAEQHESAVGAERWRKRLTIARADAGKICACEDGVAALQIANKNILVSIGVPGNEVVGQTGKGDKTSIRANRRFSGWSVGVCAIGCNANEEIGLEEQVPHENVANHVGVIGYE